MWDVWRNDVFLGLGILMCCNGKHKIRRKDSMQHAFIARAYVFRFFFLKAQNNGRNLSRSNFSN